MPSHAAMNVKRVSELFRLILLVKIDLSPHLKMKVCCIARPYINLTLRASRRLCLGQKIFYPIQSTNSSTAGLKSTTAPSPLCGGNQVNHSLPSLCRQLCTGCRSSAKQLEATSVSASSSLAASAHNHYISPIDC